ncbi:Visual pigment-like receptor peropsin [Papilio machaon]|uniref:Visual pigment-like receptor peropsin n=1 Tax=Papilio machaon TaxID=76193 RepID=A0A194R3L0_PAPMA|nr:Visual pigment-like receptor peropsin [Papilio machaon]
MCTGRVGRVLSVCKRRGTRSAPNAAALLPSLCYVIRMQALFDYQENGCPWYYFDSSYKMLLGACLIVFGVFGVLVNGWLFATFIHSHLLISKSHILVLNLCTASLGRNILGFPFSGSSAIEKRLHFRFYFTVVGVCWIKSAIFATPPLFGYGVYSCDSTGTICSFLWPALTSSTKELGYSVPYVILCGLVPLIAIFHFMGKAVRLEQIYYRNEQLKEEKRLTKSVHGTCIATLALWVPAGVLAGWQWVPLLIYGYRPHVPPALSLLAPIASEAATSIPVLCYLCGDERLRAALLGRMRKQYGLLRPDRAQRYMRA